MSIGASWNYVKGSVASSVGSSASYSYTVSGSGGYDGTYYVDVSNPDLKLDWQANTFDFTLQVSKNLLIFTPYAGAGYTIGIATVKGGMAASTSVYQSDHVTTATADQINAIEQAAGVSIDDQGFLVTSESTTPVFRVYGGTSINIFIVKIDLMASYVPASQSLGAQVMARVQL